jgi:galactitol PTS system EIIA component
MANVLSKTNSAINSEKQMVNLGGQCYEIFGFILNESGKEESLQSLAKELFKQGLVHENYGDAVLQREKEFPTGLPTEPIHVAIPHSDQEYAIRSGVAVAKLNNPIFFNNMGNPEEELSVKLIFMLAMPRAEQKVFMISSIINLIQNQEMLIRLMEAKTGEELVDIVKKYSAELEN